MTGKVEVGAFAFGTPSGNRANSQIAEAAENDARENEADILTQPDIEIKGEGLSVEYIKEKPGKPSPTLRIARWMVHRCKEKGVDILLLEAAPDHQWRVRRDVARAIKEVGANISIVMSKRIDSFDFESWCSEDSTQPRTQSREAFMKRENILKKMPWWLYKIIAK